MNKWEWVFTGIVWALLIGAYIYKIYCDFKYRDTDKELDNKFNSTMEEINKILKR